VPETAFDYQEIEKTVKKIVGVLAHPENVKLTRIESTLWMASGKTISDYFTNALTHFRVTFPYLIRKRSGSPGPDLRSFPEILSSLPA